MKPLPGIPISFGLDGGSTPAIVFGQKLLTGQIRVCGELVIFQDGPAKKKKLLAKLGPTSFGREARAFVDATWPRATIGDIWGDPAMFHGGDEEDLSWAETFGKAFGKKVRPSPVKGNRLTPRLEAVRTLLTTNIGGAPGLLISDQCKVLRQGFNNGYVIQRVKLSNGSGRLRDEPEKNDFSHVHDALQYLVVGLTKRGNPTEDLDRRRANVPASKVSYGRGYFSGRR